MAELVSVSISSDNESRGHLILDGQDISDKVVGFQIAAEPGYAPIVTLHFEAGLVEMDGVVVSRRIVPDSEVLQKLRQIEPDEIEAEALADLGMGDKMVPKLLEHIIQKVEDGITT